MRRQETRDGTEQNAAADNECEEERKMRKIVREYVDTPEETLGLRPHPIRKRVVEHEREQAREEPVEHGLDHERHADIAARCAHQLHDTDLVARGVDREAYGVKGNSNSGGDEDENDDEADLGRGIADVLEAIDGGAMRVVEVVDLVDVRRLRGVADGGLLLEELRDRVVLRDLLSFHHKNGTERIGTELVERLQGELVVLMAVAERGELIVAGDVRRLRHLRQRIERFLERHDLTILRAGREVDTNVGLVAEILKREVKHDAGKDNQPERKERNGHHQDGRYSNETIAPEVKKPRAKNSLHRRPHGRLHTDIVP